MLCEICCLPTFNMKLCVCACVHVYVRAWVHVYKCTCVCIPFVCPCLCVYMCVHTLLYFLHIVINLNIEGSKILQYLLLMHTLHDVQGCQVQVYVRRGNNHADIK